MTPSHKWFPSSLQERSVWFANFASKFSTVGVSLGFTEAELTAVENDSSVVQFLAFTAGELANFRAAVKQYRDIITEGEIGDPTPAFPANVSFVLPSVVPTGIFERLDNLVKRIRVAPAYTNEIGALLGIIPAAPAPQPESGLKPNLNVTAMPGNVVEVKFVRGNTEGVVMEMKIDNAETWSDAGRYFSSPVNLTIPENPAKLPRAVQIRARYVDRDTLVGQYSLAVTTATQPEG
jgi:hypothetical protein